LIPAIEAAIAANPDAAVKIREGKVQVVGVIVGAVMKTTGGSADAAKVRELVLKTLGQ
jgi:aspartyl-tRNA(Asn)/glutamyl-tRNA(Gln) amidotransferase subunit B